jgi:ATP-dependent DNA helicase RecQ
MPVQLDQTAVAAQVPALLRTLAGPAAVPHPEQLAAIQAVVADRRRVLVVQRTGWGKSAVYSWPPDCCATPAPAPRSSSPRCWR